MDEPCARRTGVTFAVAIPAGMPPDEARQLVQREHFRHVAAALAEGLCPYHGTPLEPVPAAEGIGGRCARCVSYWRALADEVTWDLGYDPHTGQPVVPAWAAAAKQDAALAARVARPIAPLTAPPPLTT